MVHDSSSSERPSQQRTRRKRGKRAKTPRAVHWSVQYGVLGIMLVLLLVAGGFLRALDHTVRSQFEGKRWALPARVYARPLELFVDLPLTPDDLTSELTSLGYRRPEQPDGPGSFTRQGDTIISLPAPFGFGTGRNHRCRCRPCSGAAGWCRYAMRKAASPCPWCASIRR